MAMLAGLAMLLQQEVRVEKEWRGEDSRIPGTEYHRIMKEEDCAALWKRHAREGVQVPCVDFERQMVLGIFVKEPAAYALELRGAIETKEQVAVTYSCHLQKSGGANPSRYVLLLLPRSSKRVVITSRNTLMKTYDYADKIEKVFEAAVR